NEGFLATLRSATGGRAITLPTEPWTHDLRTNAASTDLWPTLLLLALLLWPLDIALRRVSLGRRELVDAGRWVRGGWRRRSMAPRTTEVAGMLAARDRAAGSATRAALMRTDDDAAPVSRPIATTPVASAGRSDATPPPAAPTPAPTSAPAPAQAPAADGEGDTLSRLRDAKRRARER
ncbi:MAG TPA: hypothetical protein VFK35_03050, partial [Candidatus Limnocylindrales bacterium]|nr:hypothetical protein [Candidatus Limnocylindrales bacterium]